MTCIPFPRMQTPRIRMVGISYFTLVLVSVYYCVTVPSSAPQLCVLYIKKLHCSKPLSLDSVSQCPCSTHHLAGFLLTISHHTDLKNSCSSQTFTATNIYFIILLLGTFPLSLSAQQAAFLARQQRWILVR